MNIKNKSLQEELIALMKQMILLENELSRGTHTVDRILLIEAMLKELINEYTLQSKEFYQWTQSLEQLLIIGRKRMSIKKLQEYAQDIREHRKKLEKLNFCLKANLKANNNNLIERSFNRKTTLPMKKLLEPSFNVLEIYKQLILLEDHMANKTLRCPTCILKHTLFAEALAEEALALDKKSKYVNLLKKLVDKLFDIRCIYTQSKRNGYAEILKLTKVCINICLDIFNKMSFNEHKAIHF